MRERKGELGTPEEGGGGNGNHPSSFSLNQRGGRRGFRSGRGEKEEEEVGTGKKYCKHTNGGVSEVPFWAFGDWGEGKEDGGQTMQRGFCIQHLFAEGKERRKKGALRGPVVGPGQRP